MFGEFELYHSQLLHNRRLQYGYRVAPVWKVYSPETVVCFSKKVDTRGGALRIHSTGFHSTKIEYRGGREERYEGAQCVQLEPGEAHIRITVSARQSLPSLYVEGLVETDESWMADDLAGLPAPVGTHGGFCSPSASPDIFQFSYEPVGYESKEAVNGGLLFDFGRETFAKTTFTTGQNQLFVSFGESREEALDPQWSVIHMDLPVREGKGEVEPQAFRYIYVRGDDVDVAAEYEYLSLEYRGSFTCGEEVVDRVWQTAAYTFHLNSREFFLDGIKRDRWVWSGDVYQSLFVNRYLFFDPAIEQRTLVALAGKRPFEAHINTIMDYTYLWVMALHEHYVTYGDARFLGQIFPQATEIIRFCRSRAGDDGFVRQRPGDWVFIDWAPMDKTGALCGEQVLFAKALECYSQLCGVLGLKDEGCQAQAQKLQMDIRTKFYDAPKGVFVDSFESGKNAVSRHSNILVYLFLPLPDDVKQSIYRNAVLNDAVRQITTPYFKFYENQVHCEAGAPGLLEASLREYYGSLLATGATTLYEEYDPKLTGVEHYAMYGHPYEKSLCHARSASPIYLLGRYRLGVKNTGIAYSSFEVSPCLGGFSSFSGTVPLPDGEVTVKVDGSSVSVLATVPGGTLVLGGTSVPLEAGREVCLPTEKA